LERGKITLRVKIFFKTLLILALFVLGGSLGFKLGVNSRAKTDVAITTDLLVQIHQRIENGNPSGAKSLAEIGLLANMDAYERLKRDFFAKTIYGTNIINSVAFQKHFKEALSIKQEALTNLVFFNSIGPTNPPSQ
jgi:hypothetical protein